MTPSTATALPEGTPCWADVMLADVEAGQRFYGGLFGWTFTPPAPREPGAAVEARLAGDRVAALVGKSDGRMPTVWTVYFATPHAQATMAKIRAAGGRPVMGPTAVDGYGVTATAADPGGAVFGLWQPGSHTGFERRVDTGSYVWTEVHTRETAAVDTFYAQVFGYRMRSVPTGTGQAAPGPRPQPPPEPPVGRYTAPPTRPSPWPSTESRPAPFGRAAEQPAPDAPLAPSTTDTEAAGEAAPADREPATGGATGSAGGGENDGDFAQRYVVWVLPNDPVDEEHAVAGRVPLDPALPRELPAHFLVYFAVTDCDEAVRTAVGLGGRVRREPRTTRFGRHAVLLDNQGAVFAVIDTETTSE